MFAERGWGTSKEARRGWMPVSAPPTLWHVMLMSQETTSCFDHRGCMPMAQAEEPWSSPFLFLWLHLSIPTHLRNLADLPSVV